MLGQLILANWERVAGYLQRRVPSRVVALLRVAVPRNLYVWVRVRSGLAEGLQFKLNPRTGKDYYLGTSEMGVQRVLGEWLRPGMVFYDIGANVGYFALGSARCVGRQGKVYAFDPEPKVLDRLRSNALRNRLANVRTIDSAVWSQTGTFQFHQADPSISPERGTGRVSGDADMTSPTVPCVTLDDFINLARPPDVIKCDVEGGELEVLKGAMRLLREHGPKIVCEIHHPIKSADIEAMLTDCRYQIGRLDENHIIAVKNTGN